MHKKIFTLLTITFLCIFTINLKAQTLKELRKAIYKEIVDKKATVGIAISGTNGSDTLSINGDKHFAMQSVFKLHIAIAMLDAIDQKKFTLNQIIEIPKSSLLPGLWSPIREKYPEGTSLSIADIITYTVGWSDNVGCDVLLDLLGGPQQVEAYFRKLGIQDLDIKINEEIMQNNWDMQYLNWTTPKSANQVLKLFYTNDQQLLSADNYNFLVTVLQGTETGKRQLKGLLPEGTMVAHKTGNSGIHKTKGITAALNDIGIVYPVNGEPYFISVFVSNSFEDTATNERIIANISKLVWDYYTTKP